MAYEVWLSWNNKEDEFQLPINPSKIEINDGGNGSTYDVAGLGEVQAIKSPQLKTYAFEGLFPTRNYPFASAPAFAPVTVDGVTYNIYVYYIEKWLASKRPIRFMVSGDGYSINTAVSIESFSWQDVAGSGGDITYSLKLKEYVFYAAKKVTVNRTAIASATTSTASKSAPARPNEKKTPSTYTMVAGDTLWKVAQTQLGNGARWPEIQRLNGITDAEIKRLPVGKVLKLP
jgi:LysM repeat protein